MVSFVEIAIGLIGLALTIPASALVLWLVSKIFKTPKGGFMLALKTAAVVSVGIYLLFGLALGTLLGIAATTTTNVAAVAGAALLVGLLKLAVSVLANSFAVKKFYELETGKAFIVGSAWLAIYMPVALIVALLTGIISLPLILAGGLS